MQESQHLMDSKCLQKKKEGLFQKVHALLTDAEFGGEMVSW